MCGVCGVRWIRSEVAFEIIDRWRSKNDPRADVCSPMTQHTSASPRGRFIMEWPWGILDGGVGTVLGDDAKSFRKPKENEGSEPYGSPFGNPLLLLLVLQL